MPLIRLTAIAHPDLNNGNSYPVYVASEHIVLIELSKTSQERYGWREQQHDLTSSFWEEVQRVNDEIRANSGKMIPESDEGLTTTRRWTERRDIAASVHAAFGIINQQSQTPQYYPPYECTCIQLAVPNARYTMLPAVYVTESPEEVAAMWERAR